VAAAAALASCGQVDETGVGVRVLITTDDGARTLIDRRGVDTEDEEPALAVLRRATRVAVDGRGAMTTVAGRTAGSGRTWTLWLNGAPLRTGELKATGEDINLQQLPKVNGARTTEVHNGDTLWLDLRPAGAPTPRGVVGTFPEPFQHGQEGKRWPVRVECAEERGQACRMVRDALVRFGIPAVTNLVRSSYNPGSARISVGTWTQIREDPAAGLAERGTRTSGIAAVPSKDGRRIGLTDPQGDVVRTLGAGTGLIFGSRYRDEPPSWAVTGTDDAGVLRAAGALDETTLKGKIAVAVTGGDVLPLPQRTAAR
jgi:uncharacterized protein RhaS with RHS repeats